MRPPWSWPTPTPTSPSAASPCYISGEVAPWTSLAHRTAADLAATGIEVRVDVPQIASKLVIPSCKNEGQLPSVATAYRVLAEDGAADGPG
ncbi:hypothetical protein [Streptomyces sp. NPDC093568]|uniref:hypothetical protein n=1 Tax=Streptomyces sp. NPDC093568 TaxID=3366041 RepID=UPI0038294CFB